jgi:hypothetical protein
LTEKKQPKNQVEKDIERMQAEIKLLEEEDKKDNSEIRAEKDR